MLRQGWERLSVTVSTVLCTSDTASEGGNQWTIRPRKALVMEPIPTRTDVRERCSGVSKSISPKRRVAGSATSGTGWRNACTVPAFDGNIRLAAECQPDGPRRFTCGNGLIRGSPAQLPQHQVTGEHATIRATELGGHRRPEFAEFHGIKRNAPQTEEYPGARVHSGVSVDGRSSTCDEIGIQLGDEFVWDGVGNRFDSFDDR